MITQLQVVVDCSAPHELADWWADALGWEAEPSDETFIRRMIDAGYATDADTTTHRGVLVWTEGAAIRCPEPGRPRVLFQLVPEAKTVKNRLHLDLQAGPGAREETVARLVGMGASELHRGRQGPHEWATLADPEGNEFCVA